MKPIPDLASLRAHKTRLDQWLFAEGKSCEAARDLLGTQCRVKVSASTVEQWRRQRQFDQLLGRIKQAARQADKVVKGLGGAPATMYAALVVVVGQMAFEAAMAKAEGRESAELPGLTELLFTMQQLRLKESEVKLKRAKLQLELRKYRDALRQARAEVQKLRDPQAPAGAAERAAILDRLDALLGLA